MNTDERRELVPFCFGERIVRAFADDNGNPWFVAKDVCNILELENVTKALYGLDDDEVADLTISEVSSNGVKQNRNVNTVSESGLYALVFRSRKPEARAFSKWVRAEVLPAIRKTGRYETPGRRGGKAELPENMPPEALCLKPAMRQRLWRDALDTVRLDGGGIDQAVLWFGRLCRTVAATPPAPPSGQEKVRAFYYQCCQQAPGVKTRSATLYEAFRRWHSTKEGHLPSKKVFGSCMQEFGRYCRSNGSMLEGVCLK